MFDRIKFLKAIAMFSGTLDTRACALRLSAFRAVTESKMTAARPELITVSVVCKMKNMILSVTTMFAKVADIREHRSTLIKSGVYVKFNMADSKPEVEIKLFVLKTDTRLQMLILCSPGHPTQLDID